MDEVNVNGQWIRNIRHSEVGFGMVENNIKIFILIYETPLIDGEVLFKNIWGNWKTQLHRETFYQVNIIYLWILINMYKMHQN